MIITPIVFVLIVMIVAVPVSLKAFGVLKAKVYEMQPVLCVTQSDYAPDSAYFDECKKDGIPQVKEALKIADKVGELECDNAAVGCDLYYGINRVSKRDGAGVSAEGALFGSGGEIHIDGDASGSFKALKNVEIGDVFTVTAPDGEYQYTVKTITVGSEFDGKVKGEYLLLSTDSDSAVFAHQNKNKLFVVATLGTEEVH